MAQRSSRKRRKGRQRARGEDKGPAENQMARRYARAREKDAEARAALVPLEEGERPGAVTAAGVVALLLGLANIGLYAANVEVQGDRPSIVGVLFYAALMFVAAWGCFTSRYWAVLGMQVLLGLLLVVFGVLLLQASNLLAVVVSVGVIASAGYLFWKLVKAMARIQMPQRPGAG